MRGTRIQDMKYRGYLIRPTVTGFKVYRKDYFVAEFATAQIAKRRIDRVADKKQYLLDAAITGGRATKSKDSGQIDLF